MCLHTCTYASVSAYMHVCVCACPCMYTCMCACACVCSACMCVQCMHVCGCMYACMWACICVHACMHASMHVRVLRAYSCMYAQRHCQCPHSLPLDLKGFYFWICTNFSCIPIVHPFPFILPAILSTVDCIAL